MPFRSPKQRAFLYARHPEIAKRWTREYGGAVIPSGKPKRKRGFDRLAAGERG